MEQTKYWFSDCYRRNLVDMHIEDWDDAFLAQFSPEVYLKCLQTAHIEAPMLYYQSHAGHCYFPTRVGHMHSSFIGREDTMKRLTRMCKEAGMHPVGYYSLIFNTYEEDRHPAWRIRPSEEGKSARQNGGRYGHCCPNNPEYRQFVLAQIEEMAAYFRDDDGTFLMDGMFYDMLFWPGICRCPHCQERYRKESGQDRIPEDIGWDKADFLTFNGCRTRWMGEFAMWVTEETGRLMPGVTVEHNYASGVAGGSDSGASELVNDACDYTGGDLYGDLYNHSFTAKYYYGITKHQPFEYMTCRCVHSLSAHTITKSADALAAEIFLTAAHHGASFVIDAIDPVGTMDERFYRRLGEVFERQIPYEPYFRGEMVQDVGVWYSSTGRYNPNGLSATSLSAAVNLTKTLVEANIPMGILSNRAKDPEKYKMIFVPAIAGLPDAARERIIAYAENGGVVYLSGVGDLPLAETLTGGKLTGFTEEKNVYYAPTPAGQPLFDWFTPKYPLPVDERVPVLTVSPDAEVLATLTLPYTGPTESRFASIHSNPPGIAGDAPMLIRRKYEKGNVYWSAYPLEFEQRRAYRELMLRILRDAIDTDTLTIHSNAPRQAELVTFRDGADLLVSAVDLLGSEERLPVRSFTVQAAAPKMPASVVRICPDGTEVPVPFTGTETTVSFETGDFVQFTMFRIVG